MELADADLAVQQELHFQIYKAPSAGEMKSRRICRATTATNVLAVHRAAPDPGGVLGRKGDGGPKPGGGFYIEMYNTGDGVADGSRTGRAGGVESTAFALCRLPGRSPLEVRPETEQVLCSSVPVLFEFHSPCVLVSLFKKKTFSAIICRYHQKHTHTLTSSSSSSVLSVPLPVRNETILRNQFAN